MRMSEGPVELVCINDCAPNKYVKLALATALSAAETLFPGSVGILKEKALYVKLLADNDFYSHAKQLKEMGLELTVESLRSIPAGAPATSQSGELSKTGLGSSAALITSLVAAILHFFGKPHIEQTHRVAQVAHAVVQGKIGSGFDVYAACYGSSVYTRYSREAIEAAESPLASIESSLWDHKGDKIMLPCKMQLVCGDVAGGSETPSMSRKILAWKSAAIAVDGNVPDLWQRLLEANNMAIKAMKTLCSSSVVSDDQIENLKGALKESRKLLKCIGEAADVPVEPDVQTSLCDATMAIEGVIAAGVPGAGGYDAVFALVKGQAARESVERLWTSRGVCPLLLSEDKSGQGLIVKVS